MAGKIFYRQRRQADCGNQQPRYQVVAIEGLDLKIYGQHMRLKELEFIAQNLDVELFCLPAPAKRNEQPCARRKTH